MIEKITPEKAEELSVSALPTRPTAPVKAGGGGFSSAEVKRAFDALPMLIIEKYNALIDAIREAGDGSLASEIPTGISDGHTLADIFSDISNGNFSAYLTSNGKSIAAHLAELDTRLKKLEGRL